LVHVVVPAMSGEAVLVGIALLFTVLQLSTRSERTGSSGIALTKSAGVLAGKQRPLAPAPVAPPVQLETGTPSLAQARRGHPESALTPHQIPTATLQAKLARIAAIDAQLPRSGTRTRPGPPDRECPLVRREERSGSDRAAGLAPLGDQ